MVDLDQTLIHTTEQHCPQMSNKVSDSSLSLGSSHSSVRPHDSIPKYTVVW